ncbi:unnamed protein product [Choristocarpus tenellus]
MVDDNAPVYAMSANDFRHEMLSLPTGKPWLLSPNVPTKGKGTYVRELLDAMPECKRYFTSWQLGWLCIFDEKTGTATGAGATDFDSSRQREDESVNPSTPGFNTHVIVPPLTRPRERGGVGAEAGEKATEATGILAGGGSVSGGNLVDAARVLLGMGG